jgi:hypothetical protein
MHFATKVVLAILFIIMGSRLEIALQQSDVTPKICVAEANYWVDSQAATVEQFRTAKK